MASIKNVHEFTCSDGATDYFNVNTSTPAIEVPNGASIVMYSDNYTTAGMTLTTSGVAPTMSSSAAATASSGTITTSGVGVARISPAAAITGVIMQAGTVNGQQCWVVNEATAEKYCTFAASGTSNVANGVNETIPGLQARLYVWNGTLWYAMSRLINGTASVIASTSAAATASSGTITTSGVGVARINPAAAITGVIMEAGSITGQMVWVSNEATAEKSCTFAAQGTSNVANGVAETIPGLQARLYVWNGTYWYSSGMLVNGTTVTIQSSSAASLSNSSTITTSGVGVARTTNSGAVTGIIMQAGTVNGQKVTVTNETANSGTMATSGTSNVADGTSCVIAANTARDFVWNGTLWYRCG